MSPTTNIALARTVLVTVLCFAHAAPAAPLGRLFFTAEQRAALEYRWQTGQAGAAKPAANGLVWRSAGRSTLWLDGAPLYQKSATLRLEADGRDPSRVDLRLAGRPPLRLRVGGDR